MSSHDRSRPGTVGDAGRHDAGEVQGPDREHDDEGQDEVDGVRDRRQAAQGRHESDEGLAEDDDDQLSQPLAEVLGVHERGAPSDHDEQRDGGRRHPHGDDPRRGSGRRPLGRVGEQESEGEDGRGRPGGPGEHADVAPDRRVGGLEQDVGRAHGREGHRERAEPGGVRQPLVGDRPERRDDDREHLEQPQHPSHGTVRRHEVVAERRQEPQDEHDQRPRRDPQAQPPRGLGREGVAGVADRGHDDEVVEQLEPAHTLVRRAHLRQVGVLGLGLGVEIVLVRSHGGDEVGVGDAEHAHGEEAGVAGVADRDRRHRHPSGHLDDRQQGVHAVQRATAARERR